MENRSLFVRQLGPVLEALRHRRTHSSRLELLVVVLRCESKICARLVRVDLGKSLHACERTSLVHIWLLNSRASSLHHLARLVERLVSEKIWVSDERATSALFSRVVYNEADGVRLRLRSIFLLMVDGQRFVGFRLIARVVRLDSVFSVYLLRTLNDLVWMHHPDLLGIYQVRMIHLRLK